LLSTYYHSHFLAATLGFTSFFMMAFLGATHFFYSWAVFGLDFTSFCNCTVYCKAGILSLMVLLFVFFHYAGRYMQCSTYMCIMHTFFFTSCLYFVHINDCRLIKSKLNTCSSSAINRLLSSYQPSWMLEEWLIITLMNFI